MRAVVAATKLTIPGSRQPLVPRPELSARLDGDHRMALVSAPAGYGKTATLSSWAHERAPSVAWLSCDPSDAEPTRFMAGLLAAISTRWPGAADDALVLLDRDGNDLYDAAVAVANGLADVEGAGVIIVDDLHLATPSRVVLAAFIDALPADVMFVAGTRSDPPLSLARLRLHGDLLELRTGDLRFTAAETARFFEMRGVTLAADELLRLHDLTEGWPAGIQLAAIALQRGAGYDSFTDALARTDRAVADFLVSEVLDLLPAELEAFLLETSVLDTFDAGLCEAVTGSEDSEVLLERLLADSLFVVALDDRTHRYRYHHLFGAFLRARLASTGSAKLRAAHERACRALEERGDTAGALQHCMATRDVERAGHVLRSALGRFLSMSDGADSAIAAVRLWLHEFGATFVDSDPTWVVEFVTELIMLTGADEGPAWLERVRRAHPDADGELTALIEAAWGEHDQHRGAPVAALDRLRVASAAVGGNPPHRGLLALLHESMARAHILAGDLGAARHVVDRALRHPVGSPIADAVRHPGLGAFVAAADGDLTRAAELAARADGAADQLGLGCHEPGRILAGLARLEVHIERNDLTSAESVLDDVKEASELSHRLTLRSLVALQEVELARRRGDEAVARQLLAQARVCFAEPDAAIRRVLDEEAVAQALQFDPSQAGALIAGLDQGRVETGVLRVRLALLEGDDRTAAGLLAALPAPTTRRTRVERGIQHALAVLEHDVDGANRHLDAALTLGRPEGLVRAIVEQGPHVHKLLLSCPSDDGLAAYVEELLVVTSHMVAPVRVRVAPTLAEPLSDREVTVLRYLCSRLTYREIAAALYVSLNTLKSHVRSVYRKLGVESRQAAVEAGRRCALI